MGTLADEMMIDPGSVTTTRETKIAYLVILDPNANLMES